MKIGIFSTNIGPLANADGIKRVFQCAENSGFESAWTGEHVVLIDPQKPPSPIPPETPFMDTIATLAYAAAVTTRLKLGSGIILLAQRNPVVLAKELASIDQLSGGRLLFGLGVGYVPGEFDALGIPYNERGARTSENIEVLRTLWTQDQPSFNGRFTQFSGIQSKPLPVQKPHPPIFVGGGSAGAFRRAIKHGDGWYGFSLDEEQTEAALTSLRKAADEAGRASRFDELEISITPRGAIDSDRLKRFEDLGVDRLILNPPGRALRADKPADAVCQFIEDTGKELKLS